MRVASILAVAVLGAGLAGCVSPDVSNGASDDVQTYQFMLDTGERSTKVEWDWEPGEVQGGLTVLLNGTTVASGRFLLDGQGRVLAVRDDQSIRFFYGEDQVYGGHPLAILASGKPPFNPLGLRALLPPPAPGPGAPTQVTSECHTQCPSNHQPFNMEWSFSGTGGIYAEVTRMDAPQLNATWTWTLVAGPHHDAQDVRPLSPPAILGECRPVPCEDDAWPPEKSLVQMVARVEALGTHTPPTGRIYAAAAGSTLMLDTGAVNPAPYAQAAAVAYFDDDNNMTQTYGVERYAPQVMPWSAAVVTEMSPRQTNLRPVTGPPFLDTQQGVREVLDTLGLEIEDMGVYAVLYEDRTLQPDPLYANSILVGLQDGGLDLLISGGGGVPLGLTASSDAGKQALDAVWQNLVSR